MIRTELLQLVNGDFVYDEHDFHYVFDVASKIDKEKFESLLRKQKEIEREVNNEEEFMTYIDDLNWYTYLEDFFIWHSCLIRLQGIFEGLIMTKFLTDRIKNGGLKTKLESLVSHGYKIDQSDFDELILWSKIRNGLAHFPPHAYIPGILTKDDVEEYLLLCKRVIFQLNNTRPTN